MPSICWSNRWLPAAVSLGGGDCLQHALAVGENIAIGAVAAEQKEAAQVDGLLEHGLQRVVDLVDQQLGFFLLGGGRRRSAGLDVNKGGDGNENKDEGCERGRELPL